LLYKLNITKTFNFKHDVYISGITSIEPEWLPLFAESHVTLSKPMEEPAPRYDKVKGQVSTIFTSLNCYT
jgi:hypothetical protein